MQKHQGLVKALQHYWAVLPEKSSIKLCTSFRPDLKFTSVISMFCIEFAMWQLWQIVLCVEHTLKLQAIASWG